MTFLPLVQRELLAAARRKSTFRLRSWTAVIALAMTLFLFVFIGLTPGRSNPGGPLFTVVTHYVFCICLLAGPFLTADSLSQEKREGTLGLLFLTDLKGYDVVLGKFIAAFLNAFYALLALLPIVAMPLLLGGVTNGEFWRMSLALGNALFVSLACGMVVSTLSNLARKALGSSLILVIVLAGFVPAYSLPFQANPALFFAGFLSPSLPFIFATESAGYSSAPSYFWTSLACSNLLAWFFLALSSRLLPRVWQSGPHRGSHGQRVFQFRFKTNRSRRGNQKHLLDANPVLWIMRDVYGARFWTWVIVLAWGALLVAVSFYQQGQAFLVFSYATICGFILKVMVAAQACRFFSESRQSGSLELLLSTPIRDSEIIKGQWLVLKRIFLWPTILFLLLTFLVPAVGAFISNTSQTAPLYFGLVAGAAGFVWFVIGFVADAVAAAWFGMWLALTMKRPQLATAATVFFVLILPLCGSKLADIFFILWGAIKLHQDLRWTVAQQYQRANLFTVRNPANVPPIIARLR